MNVQLQPNFRTAERRLPFECVALVLQGGGALGAYQAGVYEALAEANINPDWVAGVSIGAINSAIIAGNETSERVAKLRTFWQEITTNPLLDWVAAAHTVAPKGYLPRALFNQLSASCAITAGAAGFFTLRQPAPWLHPNGAPEATSFYETKLLKSTLERLVDFDRINAGDRKLRDHSGCRGLFHPSAACSLASPGRLWASRPAALSPRREVLSLDWDRRGRVTSASTRVPGSMAWS